MTIVGKMLVIINLVFSLAVGAMGAYVYIARVNYSDALKTSEAYRQMDKANANVYKSQVDEVRTEMQARIDQASSALRRVQDDLTTQQGINKTLNDKLAAQEQQTAKVEALATRAEAEVAKRQADVEKLNQTLKTEQEKNIRLVLDANKLSERTTAAEIQFNTIKNINGRLEKQLEDLARDNARLKANAGATTTVATRAKGNPPPEMVQGLVKTADASGLVKISLGSDAGLVRGHTLEVFRLNTNNPNLSKYLGTIRIIEVSATEAVGQPAGKLLGNIQAGDTVASRILGG
jgi:hypothetical protein